MNASHLAHLALLRVYQERTDKMDLNDLCQTFVSSRPKERRESLWQIGDIVLTRAVVQNCMWNVQCAVHYYIFIW